MHHKLRPWRCGLALQIRERYFSDIECLFWTQFQTSYLDQSDCSVTNKGNQILIFSAHCSYITQYTTQQEPFQHIITARLNALKVMGPCFILLFFSHFAKWLLLLGENNTFRASNKRKQLRYNEKSNVNFQSNFCSLSSRLCPLTTTETPRAKLFYELPG